MSGIVKYHFRILNSQAGGQLFVQDLETSAVWGMPGFVARAGLADKVLPLGKLAGEIAAALTLGRPELLGSLAPRG